MLDAKSKILELELEIEEFQNEVNSKEILEEMERLSRLTHPFVKPSKPETEAPHAQRFNIGGEGSSFLAGREAMPTFTFKDGTQTPISQAAYEGHAGGYGKQVDEKIDLEAWPQISGFRVWKMAFKKAVAAASSWPQEAFFWITQVESAKSSEDLADSGNFAELDAKLGKDLDKIMSGEFKNTVQIKEAEYSKVGKCF